MSLQSLDAILKSSRKDGHVHIANQETLATVLPTEVAHIPSKEPSLLEGQHDETYEENVGVAADILHTDSQQNALPLPTEEEEKKYIMHRFTLYETATRFYLVGQDITERHFRILKIDRTAPVGSLSIFEDENIYDTETIRALLTSIEDGNKGTGGLKLKTTGWGLLGFIKFTDIYYMLLITKRLQAAMIGGHYVYQIEGTELVPLAMAPSSRFSRDRKPEETRYLSIFASVDLTKSFYFSYSYNITQTLQHNINVARETLKKDGPAIAKDWNDMFVWNHYMLQPAIENLKHTFDWCMPIIHGYIDQAALDVFGRRIYLTIIARRSRFFAGARYLKRGTNDKGFVANDVETEQIVSDLVTTSFHAPGPKLFSNPKYTSYVQHRGSIPLYWSQDNSGVTPKPDIDMTLVDPFYSAAALHFDNLFQRYGAPVYVLNLIKARERTPRESKLLQEYQKALAFLNQSLPEDKKILYRAFDMSRAAKTRGQDVIGVLEIIADDVMKKTGFFQNGDYESSEPKMQNGIARTNCIDCLDRTNAAQFVIGKRALGQQLKALGIIADETVEYDSDAVNTFTHMYHAHGDTIAIQYGGSHLAHTMSTYRKINEWKSHGRDVVESVKRYYHNTVLDAQRQAAFNLFLGNYSFQPGMPMLWDLQNDFHLHHEHPRAWDSRKFHDYINWYTPSHLEERLLPEYAKGQIHKNKPMVAAEEYWLEYYRPLAITTFTKTFSYKIGSRPQYLAEFAGYNLDNKENRSPFVPRKIASTELIDQTEKKYRKGGHVMIIEPSTTVNEKNLDLQTDENSPVKSTSLSGSKTLPLDKSQWTLKNWYENLLDPRVTEEDEYVKYVDYPLKLSLVTGLEPIDTSSYGDSAAYMRRGAVPEIAVSKLVTRSDLAKYQLFDDEEQRLFGNIDPEDLADYEEFLTSTGNPDPLSVMDDDGEKKRYKAYRQWLKGRSFFKLSKTDPEYRTSL